MTVSSNGNGLIRATSSEMPLVGRGIRADIIVFLSRYPRHEAAKDKLHANCRGKWH
jgi:hypothetical protein